MTHRLEAWPTNKRPYPAKNKSVQVWIYFGFRKIKEGPANKENFEIAKAICKIYGKEYKKSFKY
jgi:hypothetical protein